MCLIVFHIKFGTANCKISLKLTCVRGHDKLCSKESQVLLPVQRTACLQDDQYRWYQKQHIHSKHLTHYAQSKHDLLSEVITGNNQIRYAFFYLQMIYKALKGFKMSWVFQLLERNLLFDGITWSMYFYFNCLYAGFNLNPPNFSFLKYLHRKYLC